MGVTDGETLLEWRGVFDNVELNALHGEGFEHRVLKDDWWGRVNAHSLGWVTLRRGPTLIGFVNIAWDGGVHAFLLDTLVRVSERRRGHAARMVRFAVENSRQQGCEWLHVDFEPHLRDFYINACGFRPTDAGLVPLK